MNMLEMIGANLSAPSFAPAFKDQKAALQFIYDIHADSLKDKLDDDSMEIAPLDCLYMAMRWGCYIGMMNDDSQISDIEANKCWAACRNLLSQLWGENESREILKGCESWRDYY